MNPDIFISVVIPVYRNAADLVYTCARLKTFLKPFRRYEILFIIDGSPDNSFEILRSEAVKNESLRIIRLNKNYGQQSAIQAGLDAALGDIIFNTDADLPLSEENFHGFIRKVVSGCDFVVGVRQFAEKRPAFRVFGSWLFSRVMSSRREIAVQDAGCSTCAGTQHLVSQIHTSLRVYGEIKALLMQRATRVCTAQIDVPAGSSRSSYSLYALAAFFLRVILIRFFPKTGRRYYEILSG